MPAAPSVASLAMMISWQAITGSTACPSIGFGQIGHGPHAVEFVAGEEVGQALGLRRNRSPGRHPSAPSAAELEDQRQPGVVLLCPLDRAADHLADVLGGLVGDRQRHLDKPADLPGCFRLVPSRCRRGKQAYRRDEQSAYRQPLIAGDQK